MLRGCGARGIEDACDEDTAALLIALYEAGHRDVLRPLLTAGLHSDGAVSEMLGAFFNSVLRRDPVRFLNTARTLNVSDQKKVCWLAGGTDGGGMSPEDLRETTMGLKRVGDSFRSIQHRERVRPSRGRSEARFPLGSRDAAVVS